MSYNTRIKNWFSSFFQKGWLLTGFLVNNKITRAVDHQKREIRPTIIIMPVTRLGERIEETMRSFYAGDHSRSIPSAYLGAIASHISRKVPLESADLRERGVDGQEAN